MRDSLRFAILTIFLTLLSASVTTPTQAQGDKPFLPADLQVITAANAGQLQQVVMLGRGDVYDLAWSPSGKYLAVAGSTGIWIYDTDSPQSTPQLLGDHTQFLTLAFGRKRLAAGDTMGNIWIWGVNEAGDIDPSPKLLKVSHSANRMRFGPDESTLVAVGDCSPVRVLDIDTGVTKVTGESPCGFIGSYTLSPDGQMVAFGVYYPTGTIEIWDTSFEKEPILLQSVGGGYDLAFSEDNRFLAANGENGDIELWDLNTKTKLMSMPMHSVNIDSLVFSPDGRLLAAGGQKGIVIWDLKTNHEYAATRHTNAEFEPFIRFRPDGEMLASYNTDGSISLWRMSDMSEQTVFSHEELFAPQLDGDILTAKHPKPLQDDVTFLWNMKTGRFFAGSSNFVVSPEGKFWAAASDDNNSIYLYDGETGNNLAILKGHTDKITGLAFNGDGTQLVSGDNKGAVYLWDIQTGKMLTSLKGDGMPVYLFIFNSQGDTLVFIGGSCDIHIWDIRQSSLRTIEYCGLVGVSMMTFSPDGTRFAVAGAVMTGARNTGGVSLYDVQTGSELASFGKLDISRDVFKENGFWQYVYIVSFNADGSTLTAVSGDRVGVWDTRNYKPLVFSQYGSIAAEGGIWISGVAFNIQKTEFTFADLSNVIHLWDMRTARERLTLPMEARVYSTVFSPDGKLLAVGTADGTVQLWDIEHAVKVTSFKAASGDIIFSTDSKLLITDGDGTIRLWGIPTER